MVRQIAEGLVHLLRPGRGVESDDVSAQRFDGGEGGSDLRPWQHSARELDGDLNLEGNVPAGVSHCPAGTVHGGFDPQEVELGLDDQEVDAAVDETRRLDLIRLAA